MEVNVLLSYDQARAEGVDLSAVRDRFQVVAVGVESKDNLVNLWKDLAEASTDKTMIKCKARKPGCLLLLLRFLTPLPQFVRPDKVKVAAESAALGSLDTSSVMQQSFMSPIQPSGELRRSSGGDTAGLTNSSGGAPGGTSPTMEQAKAIYKTEMASSKLKKELSAIREEKEQVDAALLARDKRIFQLEEELRRLREHSSRAPGQHAPRGRPNIVLLLFFWLLALCVGAYLAYKATGFDVLASLEPSWSMGSLDARLTRALVAFREGVPQQQKRGG